MHRLSSSKRTVRGKRRGRSDRAAAPATAGEGMTEEGFDDMVMVVVGAVESRSGLGRVREDKEERKEGERGYAVEL